MNRLTVSLKVTMETPPLQYATGLTGDQDPAVGMWTTAPPLQVVPPETITVASLDGDGMSPATIADALRGLADDLEEQSS